MCRNIVRTEKKTQIKTRLIELQTPLKISENIYILRKVEEMELVYYGIRGFINILPCLKIG